MKTHLIAAIALCACFWAQASFVDERGAATDGRPPTGVAPAETALPAAPAGVQAQKAEWRIELNDGSLSRALRRWAREARYPILWEAPKDLPAVAATYRASYLDAIKQVMEDSQNSSYPLHACAYDNVVRVLHTSQACNR